MDYKSLKEKKPINSWIQKEQPKINRLVGSREEGKVFLTVECRLQSIEGMIRHFAIIGSGRNH